MHRVRIALAGVAACSLLAFGSEAQASTTTITSCGQTVMTNAVLAHSLNCTGDGILIGAPGISIDLKGHAVRGDGGMGDYGVIDGASFGSVTIKNGVIRNFDGGVWAAVADHVTVSGITTVGNLSAGIFVEGNGASISKVTAVGNTRGISIVGSDAKVTAVLTAENVSNGLEVTGSDAQIKGVTASNNTANGITVDLDNASITSSSAYGNGTTGLHVDGDFATIKSSTAYGNGSAGIEVNGKFATVTCVQRQSGNSGPGIHTDGNAPTIQHNVANANGFDTTSAGRHRARDPGAELHDRAGGDEHRRRQRRLVELRPGLAVLNPIRTLRSPPRGRPGGRRAPSPRTVRPGARSRPSG